MKMHDGEIDIDAGFVGRLVAAQFPALGGLPVRVALAKHTLEEVLADVVA